MSEGGNMARIASLALKAKRRVRVSDRIVGYRAFVDLGAETIS